MMRRNILVSGGIGCGKSFVLGVFNALGIPSYDADSRAKGLYDTDSALLAAVVDAAGEDVLSGGRLDRKALASKIFASPELRARIEALVHPAVMRDFARWRDGQDCPLAIMESAILLEHPDLLADMDWKVVVTAPMDVRVKRIALRDNATPEQIAARIASQCDDSRRVGMADFVIENDGIKAILPQIIVFLKQIKFLER